jgi:hypothetical protein
LICPDNGIAWQNRYRIGAKPAIRDEHICLAHCEFLSSAIPYFIGLAVSLNLGVVGGMCAFSSSKVKSEKFPFIGVELRALWQPKQLP